MPTPRASLLVIAALAAASLAPLAHAQTVRRGPIFNPATGSRYYMLEADFATARAWAQQRVGGDLATISTAAENAWITTNFTASPLNDEVEIGLNDIATEGTFVWADGSADTYRNWAGGTPEAAGNTGIADVVRLMPTGLWQVRPDPSTPFALVETSAPLQVPGEFATLQAAITFAQSTGGGVIEVAPGTYDLPGRIDITRGTTIRGTAPGVVIRSSTSGGVNLFLWSSLRLENLAVVMRLPTSHMIEVYDTMRLQIVNVTVTADRGMLSPPFMLSAGVVSIERSTFDSVGSLVAHSTEFPESSILTISNSVVRNVRSVITNNLGTARSASFVNCTFVNVGGGNGPAIVGAWPFGTLANSVIVNPGPNFYGGLLRVTHCLVPAPVPALSDFGGNVVGAPQFVNAAAGDFRLLPTSPGIDAGSAAGYAVSGASDFTDFNGVVRGQDIPSVPNTGQSSLPIDIGAFELPATPPPPPCVPDLNNDGELTFDDIQAFIAAFNAGC
jgi:hypothetical protein